MRQVIQEGFIKDTLPNYTSYKTYFRIIKKITSDPSYDKGKASRLLKTFVEMNEHTIDKKTTIIINHFMENCHQEIGGLAKAMVVCSSRVQAVKYKIAFDKYINDNQLDFKALVAFSGDIENENARQGEPKDYSEARMNGFPEEQTANRFREAPYKFLIVANKFQTGFDQPLLYAMYINKKLQGVNAVQTLSRLNRVFPGKKDPITLDFANDEKVIQKSFQDFYEGVLLEEGSDPDKLYDFKRTLDDFHYYGNDEVEKFSAVLFGKNFQQEKLVPILQPAINNFKNEADKDRKEKFRVVLKSYVRVYAFLSQLVSFNDPALEKLYVFGKVLLRKLPYEKQKLPKDVTQQVDLDSIKIQYSGTGIKVKPGEGGKFKPGDENPMGGGQEYFKPLSALIKNINEKYSTNFTDKDKVIVDSLFIRLKADQMIQGKVKNNPKENVWYSFERKFNEELQSVIEENYDFYKKLNNDTSIKEEMMKQMFVSLYESMKKAG